MAAVVPELGWMLSELGADVVKVESQAHPDVLRQAGMGRINASFAFNAECRGRRSVALDITTERGRELAFALCARADVVAENHRGGVLEHAGLGYEAVRAANPGVVYVSSQGYGRGGPFGEMPAYGPLNSGFNGVHLLWNQPDAPYPCGTSLNHPDHIAGKLLAVAVLAALGHRARTGEGQPSRWPRPRRGAYLVRRALPRRRPATASTRSRSATPHPSRPHGVYPSAGDDRWLAIAVIDDDGLGRPARRPRLAAPDPALATAAGRVAARARARRPVAEWTQHRTAEAAAELLQAHGVSAMPVMGPRDHHADPHLAARGAIVRLHHPEVGPERHVANPTRWSRLADPGGRARAAASAPTPSRCWRSWASTPTRSPACREAGVCR